LISGDLWSYNWEKDVFVVSPEPDTHCHDIDISKHRCLILGTDGCWNMLNAKTAVDEVCSVEKSNEQHMLNPQCGKQWINPSKRLVDCAIDKWNCNQLRADNTSVVTVMLDPPGPPRAQVLKRQRELLASSGIPERGSMALVTNKEEFPERQPQQPSSSASKATSEKGLSIISRFPNAANLKERNLADGVDPSHNRVLHDFQPRTGKPIDRLSTSHKMINRPDSTADSNVDTDDMDDIEDRETDTPDTVILDDDEENIQCNEVSSSDDGKSLKSPRRGGLKRSTTSALALTPKLSRELSALQIDRSANRGRTRSCSESEVNNSDTENEAPKAHNSSTKKKFELREEESATQKMLKNNPHFLRSKEAKVKKSASIAGVPSANNPVPSSPTTVMSLRPRPAISADQGSSRKRKPELEVSSPTPKSPRMMPIVNTKPVMTRSRTARVLQLKK